MDNFLYQLVTCGGDTLRPLLAAVYFGNVFLPDRMRLITVTFERRDAFLDSLVAHTINGLTVRFRRHIIR